MVKSFLYRLSRRLLGFFARPTLTGQANLPQTSAEIVYVLQQRALSDLVMLDLACRQSGLTAPTLPLGLDGLHEPSRFFCLLRATGGRMTMARQSKRLQRLLSAPQSAQNQLVLVPVTVFWGRAMGNTSLWNSLTSEHWAVTGRFKRFLNLLINRRNIFVHTGRPVALSDLLEHPARTDIMTRRVARLLRVRMRQQRQNALGPDFSHRRTLVEKILNAKTVRAAIATAASAGAQQKRQIRLAHRHAHSIASDMSHPTVRALARLLRWFWHRIYDGIEVTGLDSLEEVSSTHTLVYVPSHRSHLDYLLLSYLLYYRGFMIPHIAAGDNLNLPILGGILRRCGAFFMRRSFRDDPLYAAVFNEYLYQVYHRGHCVEFFPEGGRTRTGRMLPPRLGLLKMSLEHQQRGLPKPLAFIPVFFGYEKLVEASSYLSELRGADKSRESIGDVVRNIRLIRQNFGRVEVNFGAPIKLDEWLDSYAGEAADAPMALGKYVIGAINENASLNPVHLVALVTLATPKVAIEAYRLEQQIDCYQQLIERLHADGNIRATRLTPAEIIAHVEYLGMLQREQTRFGTVFGHAPFTAVLMTWYRNNVVHTLALPALIACLLVRRRRGVSRSQLGAMVEMIYPYLANELSAAPAPTPAGLSNALDAMQALGLLQIDRDEIAPPPPEQAEHLQLTLLANLVTQTLERMFIVIHQLLGGADERSSLLASSLQVAERISRLYGINAPEFSDQRLFNGFIDALLQHKILREAPDGRLHYDSILERVLRAAEFVIDTQIRHSVVSAQPFRDATPTATET